MWTYRCRRQENHYAGQRDIIPEVLLFHNGELVIDTPAPAACIDNS